MGDVKARLIAVTSCSSIAEADGKRGVRIHGAGTTQMSGAAVNVRTECSLQTSHTFPEQEGGWLQTKPTLDIPGRWCQVLRFRQPHVGSAKAPRRGWVTLCSIHLTEDGTNKLSIGALGDPWHRYKWQVNTCPA